MHVIAGKAVCFGEAMQPEFKAYIKQVMANAKALAEVLMAGGLRLVSGGTDNHLMLVDVTPLGIGGKQAEHALDAAGITVNKNMIPYDQRKPMDPQRHPRRHAGADHPRHGRGRNADDRRLDARSPPRRRRRQGSQPHPRASPRTRRRLPRPHSRQSTIGRSGRRLT